MSVPALDPDLLKAFVAVADSRSFTRAATRLNRTQSAVSMQIKRLEDRLGVALFNRTKANVDLSPAGEGLLGYARRILTLNDEAVGKLQERKVLYAKHEPSLARLTELACISALAQYLSQEGVPVDVSSLFTKQPVAVDTPDKTPAIVASRSMGNHNISLSGGVDLDKTPTINKVQQPHAQKLRDDCEAWRPGAASRMWCVGDAEDDRVAITMPCRPRSPSPNCSRTTFR